MGDGSLSQDEIDALLQGADDMLSTPSVTPAADVAQVGGGLSPVERDTLADLMNATMSSAAPSLSGYLGKNISIDNAFIEVKAADDVRSDFAQQYVQVSMDFTGSVSGRNLILILHNDAGVVSSLMMGDESGTPPADLTDAHKSTIQEFISQMVSSAATQFGDKTGKPVGTSAPELSLASNSTELRLPPGAELVKVTYNLKIENLVNSKLYQILEVPFVSDLIGVQGSRAQVSQPAPQQQRMAAPAAQSGSVGISPVKFPPLGEGVPSAASGNISLLMDVPMTLTVELGRTRQLVKDILGLGEGSIIELDKLAGEPVDLLVNGKLIAKGEVVVIDENFGVRVTDIVSPAERLNKMQA